MTDPRDQHIADLRAVLTETKQWLAFVAGLVAAEYPEKAADAMAMCERAEQALRRTAPGDQSGGH